MIGTILGIVLTWVATALWVIAAIVLSEPLYADSMGAAGLFGCSFGLLGVASASFLTGLWLERAR